MAAVYKRLIDAGKINPRPLRLRPLLDDELASVGRWYDPPKTRQQAAASKTPWKEYEVRWSADGRLTAAYASSDVTCSCTAREGLSCRSASVLNWLKQLIGVSTGPPAIRELPYFHLIRFKRADASWWNPQSFGRHGDRVWTSCESTRARQHARAIAWQPPRRDVFDGPRRLRPRGHGPPEGP